VLARVNARRHRKLRWSIAHLNDASPDSLKRFEGNGVGWLVQKRLFSAEGLLASAAPRPRASCRRCQRLAAEAAGRRGTDAHPRNGAKPLRLAEGCSTAKPFRVAMRAPPELPTRIEALRLISRQRLVSFEEDVRGALAAGQLADLAVLSRDYSACRRADRRHLSLLTMGAAYRPRRRAPYAGLRKTALSIDYAAWPHCSTQSRPTPPAAPSQRPEFATHRSSESGVCRGGCDPQSLPIMMFSNPGSIR